MVVISIISILTLIAVPNFKRAYEDFSIKKTCGDVEEYCSGIQAYYLIMNEFMKDFLPEKINANIKWIFPSSFYKGSMMNIAPYGGGCYDIENWLGDSTILSFWLALRSIGKANLREKLRDILSKYLNRDCTLRSEYGAFIAIWFPEVPTKNELLKIPKNHRNRFY